MVIWNAINWLGAYNKIPFLADDLTNFEVILLTLILVGVLVVCFNKKLRNKFF